MAIDPGEGFHEGLAPPPMGGVWAVASVALYVAAMSAAVAALLKLAGVL